MDKATRRQELLDKYDRNGVETGIRLQGEHFLNALHRFDEVDPEWADHWVKWIYGHMYNRNKLDDRTRVLVIIGELTVAGDHTTNLANHVRTALTVGAEPYEIIEVILQASIYVGMPRMFRSLKVCCDLLSDLGYAEYTQSPFDESSRDER